MINHSISHGAVSLATLVGAQLLTDKIASHFPSFYTWIETLSAWILDWFDLSMLQNQMELLLV
ncbi:MAG: hypothetical protein ACE5E3_04430, partial [Mariprofundus sp.]